MSKKFRIVLTLVLICSILGSIAIFSTFTNAASTYTGYLMGYFKQTTNGYGLFLAYSTNGLTWTNLNGGNYVLYPTLGTKGLRDPYMRRKQDGTFVILATDMNGTNWGDYSQNIHCWDTTDFCTFTGARLLKVHSTTMHSWAPEAFYDYNKGKYGIIWSGNTDYNRTYVNYTTDFKTVEANQVYFDPGYDVIDSTTIQNSGVGYLFFKDERSTGKRIKAAKSTTMSAGSFSIFTPNFLTSANTEGPIVFKDNNATKWYMYDDLFANNGNFECWSTTDLNTTAWTKVSGISVPAGVRHGTVVSITQSELDKIRAKWGG